MKKATIITLIAAGVFIAGAYAVVNLPADRYIPENERNTAQETERETVQGIAQGTSKEAAQGTAKATAQETPVKDFATRLSDAALALTEDKVIYDPTYFSIPYPNGDVPANKGVCTDVVIRAYRKLGIDLQKEVHEDMKANFAKYPKNWGLTRPDTNIDNLMVFFARHGSELPITQNAEDYLPGDIVCWRLDGGATHIGIVVERHTRSGRPKIVHNIGYGQNLADCLFDWEIIGHYRYGK